MRSLISTAFVSLDGVVEAPGGEPGYRNSGWTFKDMEFVPEAFEIKGREQQEAAAMMMGRVSYEAFSPVWPDMADFADYKPMPKYVVSTTLTEDDLVSGWGETTILRSLDDVAALKETEGGPIIVHGSATLNRSLSDSRPDRPLPPPRLPAAARRGQAPVQRHGQGHPEAEARRARGVLQRPADERLRRRPLTPRRSGAPRLARITHHGRRQKTSHPSAPSSCCTITAWAVCGGGSAHGPRGKYAKRSPGSR